MQAPTQRLAVLAPLGALLVTVLVFAPGLRGGFVYDDYYLVESNSALAHPASLARFLATPLFAEAPSPEFISWVGPGTRYWRPFVKLAFLLQRRAFGLDPGGWHALSLAVHAACVLLVFVWLRRRISGSRSPAFAGAAARASTGTPPQVSVLTATLASALAALLFAVHPSRVEAVAWVSGSADLWMGFWILLGLVAWTGSGGATAALAGCCFALAVLCKEAAVLAPVCLLLDAWAAPERTSGSELWRLRARFGIALLPVAAVLAVRLALVPLPTGLALGGFGAALERGLACLGLYVGRVAWPIHPSTQIGLMSAEGRYELEPWSIVLGVVVIVAIVLVAMLARRSATARGALADCAWFVVPLLPVLQVLPLGYTTLVAERYLYVPMLGVASLVARGLQRILAGPDARVPAATAVAATSPPAPGLVRAQALATLAVGLLACGALASVTLRYLPAFRSNTALWTWELHLQPENPLLHVYLARSEARAGRLEPALRAARAGYDRAELADTRAEAAVLWAAVRLQMAQGRESDLLEQLRAFFDALAGEGASADELARLEADGVVLVASPSTTFRENLLHSTYFRTQRAVATARTAHYEAAEGQFQDLLRDDPSVANYANLVRVLACEEHWDAALETLQDGRRAHPGAAILDALGEPVTRGRALESAPAADPVQRAGQRARVWLDLGATRLVRSELAPFVTRSPEDPDIVTTLALADALDGDVLRAKQTLLAARGRDPAHAASWDAALADLARVAAPGPTPGARPDLDALFR